MLRAGDIFVGPYPPGSNKLRRFVILTDEVEGPDSQVAWVYVSTSMSNATTLLQTGCHGAITQDCCVVYEEAEVVRVSAIRSALAVKALKQFPTSLSDELILRVQEGVFDSDETPIRVVRFCTDRV